MGLVPIHRITSDPQRGNWFTGIAVKLLRFCVVVMFDMVTLVGKNYKVMRMVVVVIAVYVMNDVGLLKGEIFGDGFSGEALHLSILGVTFFMCAEIGMVAVGGAERVFRVSDSGFCSHYLGTADDAGHWDLFLRGINSVMVKDFIDTVS